jgi:hypothetical protein
MYKRKGFLNLFAVVVLLATALSGCGGGSGGGNVAGIGGTGVTAAGTITGFGSIFVNGVEFDTSNSSFDVDDNSSATETDLSLGMFVTVTGTLDISGTTGTATTVVFDDEIQGPISAIDPGGPDPDNLTKTLIVFGISILADRATTVFEDVTFDNLAVNDVIEVSGFVDSTTVLHATRIEKKDDFVAGSSEVELKGIVSGLSGTTFTLGSFTVDFSGPVDLSDVPGGVIANGMQVEVKGTLTGTTISASRIEEEDDLFGDDEDKVSLEGLITNYVSDSNFQIAGQLVDASGATFEPATLTLGNGVEVEVEGPIVNGILQASEVEARGGDIKLEATVLSVSPAANTITLLFEPGNVTVQVNSQTSLKDDQTGNTLTLAGINPGTDFLEIRGYIDGNGNIIASEVSRDDPDDDIIQAPVESFVTDSSITLLGLTFDTVIGTTDFELANDTTTNSTTFYGNLGTGDLVKIKDDNQDGIADEVEFEN